MRRILLRLPLLITLLTLCHSLTAQVEVGADQIEQILTYTAGKRVALTVNHTSVLSNPQHTHLVDTLLAKGVQVTQPLPLSTDFAALPMLELPSGRA